MYRASPNMDINVESRRKKDEGLWGAFKSGVKAMFAGESFSYLRILQMIISLQKLD